jgi:hypothetical protein
MSFVNLQNHILYVMNKEPLHIFAGLEGKFLFLFLRAFIAKDRSIDGITNTHLWGFSNSRLCESPLTPQHIQPRLNCYNLASHAAITILSSTDLHFTTSNFCVFFIALFRNMQPVVLWAAYEYLQFPCLELVSTVFVELHIWARLATINIVCITPLHPTSSITRKR